MVGADRGPHNTQNASLWRSMAEVMNLRGLRVETVQVSGALTNLSVGSTIRYGADLGDEMVLVRDVCSSFDTGWHRADVDLAVIHLGEVVGKVVTAIERG